MDIRVFLFALIIVVGLLLKNSGDNSHNRKMFINIILVALVLESCLRGLSVGSDTFRYSEIYAEVGRMSWRDVFQSMVDRYIHHADDSDAGYMLLQKMVYTITPNFNFFLLICALFFFIPLRKLLLWIDFDMDNLILLFVFYVALFNPIAMSGTRKVIALGLTILVFLYYVEKKYVKAVIWMIVAALIHMSSLAVLLVPVIDLLSNGMKKTVHGVSFFFTPVMVMMSTSIIMFMATSVENEHYELYAQNPEGGGMTFVILIELIFFACFLLFKKKDMDRSKKLSHLYSMLPIATLLAPLITNNGSMIRLSQYFHVYTLLFLPMLVDKITDSKSKVVVNMVLMAILIVLCLRTDGLGSHYYFFWADKGLLNYY